MRLRCFFFFSSRRRHTRLQGDWSSDVCSSDLLVADEHVRLHGEAAGNRDPLTLAAGEFVRILEERNLWEPHFLEQFVDPVAALALARPDAVHLQRLHEKLADRETRIERSIGVLEDDLDAALVRHHLRLRDRQQVLAVEQGLAARFPSQAQQRQRDRRLARTRFADYAQGFPPGDPERNVFDRLEFLLSEQSLARIEALARWRTSRMISSSPRSPRLR